MCVLLFDQLWMSNSGKLNVVHPIHLCTKLKKNHIRPKYDRAVEVERENKQARIKNKSSNNVDFLGWNAMKSMT